MAVFLSAARPDELQAELLAVGSAYSADTPAVIASPGVLARRAGRAHHRRRPRRGPRARSARTTTVLVLVGDALRRGESPRPQPRLLPRLRPHVPGRERWVTWSDVVGVVAAASASGRRHVGPGAGGGRRRCPPPPRRPGCRGARAGRAARSRSASCSTSSSHRVSTGRRVCVLASGDPGFFGIVRALGERLGDGRVAVHPAPSAVALAFGRLGLSWDDAAVVSAHGRIARRGDRSRGGQPQRWPC